VPTFPRRGQLSSIPRSEVRHVKHEQDRYSGLTEFGNAGSRDRGQSPSVAMRRAPQWDIMTSAGGFAPVARSSSLLLISAQFGRNSEGAGWRANSQAAPVRASTS
jgi:hypothetical protein